MNFIQVTKKIALIAIISAGLISIVTLFFGLAMLAFFTSICLAILALSMIVSVWVKERLNLWLLAPFAIFIGGLLLVSLFWGAESFAKRLFYNLAFLGLPLASCYLLYNNQRYAKLIANKLVASITLGVVSALCIVYVFVLPLSYIPKVAPLNKGYQDYFAKEIKVKANAPNVLLINTDIGIDSLSCYNGGSNAPNISALADDGMVFLNYFVQNNKEFALLTGRYPERGGLNNRIYPSKTTSLSRYNNVFLSPNNVNGILGDEISLAAILQKGGYNCAYFGIWGLGDSGQYLPTKQGFDNFYGSYFTGNAFAIVDEIDGKAQSAHSQSIDSINLRAQEFVKEQAGSNFFLEYSMPLVPFTDKDKDSTQDICYLDTQIGHIIDTLKSENVYNNTLIIFSGGCRDSFGRAPFIITYIDGNLNSGSFNDKELTAAIASIDVFPTVLFFAGIDKPEDRQIDGVNLYHLLKGNINGNSKVHNVIYFFKNGTAQAILKSENISTERQNLIYYSKKVSPIRKNALYNISLDPNEQDNLIDKESNLALSLKDELKEFSHSFAKDKRGAL